jgi:23S rRNA pseudouridine2605 synthase
MQERLQKILAHAGVASRRKAEEMILQGRVSVNGSLVTELGAKADPEHDVIKATARRSEYRRGLSMCCFTSRRT